MSETIDHFIFVPGIGASPRHPAGNLINEAIVAATGGRVTASLARTCDEFNDILVPRPLDRQAEDLIAKISRLPGRVALFAHSQGGIPAAMALEAELPQLDPADVILAGVPLDSQLSLARTLRRSCMEPSILAKVALTLCTEKVGLVSRTIHWPAVRPDKQAQCIALTQAHLDSYPAAEKHLGRLQKLGESTLLLVDDERVTDCTLGNVRLLLSGRNKTNGLGLPENVVLVKNATHNLKGLCETAIPNVIFQRIPDLLGRSVDTYTSASTDNLQNAQLNCKIDTL